MKKKNSKLIALVFAIALVISAVPTMASAFSATEGFSLSSILAGSTTNTAATDDAASTDEEPGLETGQVDGGLQGDDAPTAKPATYDGKSHLLIGNIKSTSWVKGWYYDYGTDSVRYCYKLYYNGSEITSSWEWNDEPSETYVQDNMVGINAGNYTIKYGTQTPWKGANSKNNVKWYDTSGISTCSVTISPAPLCSATGSKSEFTYNGSNQIPTFTVKGGDTGALTLSASDYTVSYTRNGSAVNADDTAAAGDYVATISGTWNDSTATGNYNGSKKVSWTIIAASLGEATGSQSTFTYNGKQQTPTITVKGVNDTPLEEGTDYTVSYSSESPTNVGTYTATITGIGNYTGTTNTVEWSITPAPTGANIKYTEDFTYDGASHDLITDVERTNNNSFGTIQYAVKTDSTAPTDGDWTTTIPTATNAGTYKVYWRIQADANGNWTASGYGTEGYTPKEIEVSKYKDNTASVTAAENLYQGTAEQSLIKEFKAPKFGTLQFKVDDDADWQNLTADNKPMRQAKGTYTVYWRVEGTDNYNGVSGNFDVEIAERLPVVSITLEDRTYTGSAQTVIKSEEIDVSGTIQYSTDKSTWVTKNNLKYTDAGTYTFYYKVDAGASWSALEPVKMQVTIKQKEITDYSVSGKTGLVFNGEKQALVDASDVKGIPEGCQVYYRVGTSGDGSTDIPTEKDAGEYTVYYKIVDPNKNYVDTEYNESDKFTVKIAKASINAVTLSATSLPWTKAGNSVTVDTVTTENGLTVSSDYYEVSGTPSASAVGEYTVTVTAEANTNFDGSANATWEITKTNQFTDDTLTIQHADGTTYSKTGASFEFKNADYTVNYKVTADGKELELNTDYVVDASSVITATAVGTHTIKITGKGDYVGQEATATWTITQGVIKSATPEWTSKDFVEKTAQVPAITAVSSNKVNSVAADGYTVSYYQVAGEADTAIAAKDIINAGTYKAVVSGTGSYKGSASFTWTINKIDIPSDCLPKAREGLRYTARQQALVDETELMKLTGVNAYYKTRVGYYDSWTDEQDSVPTRMNPTKTNAKSNAIDVKYRIDGGTNYNDVKSSYYDKGYMSDDDFDVTISTAAILKVTLKKGSSFTYDGQSHGFEISDDDIEVLAGSRLEEGFYFTVASDDLNDWTQFEIEGTQSATDVGSYKVSITPTWASGYYDDTKGGSVTWTITKADIPDTYSVSKQTGLVYNGQAQNLLAESEALPSGTTLYSKIGNGEYQSGIVQATDAGKYSVTYYVDGGNNYNGIDEKTVEVTIGQAEISGITLNEADSLPYKYSGSEQSVSVSKVFAGTGSLIEVPSTDYDITGDLKGTSRGSYTVTATAKSSSTNFKGSADITWNINKSGSFGTGALKIADESGTYSVNDTSFAYTGSEFTPAYKVVTGLGEELTEGTDYEIVADGTTLAATNAETYQIKIKGIGEYAAESNVAAATWTITPIALGNATGSYSEVTYTGSVLIPDITVTNEAGDTLVAGTDYTVAYTDSKGDTVTDPTEVGTYTATITGKGNYSATSTKTVTWEIKEDYVAKIGDKQYKTLAAAVAAASTGKATTIEMLKSVDNAAGISVPANTNITIDFGGYSYTAAKKGNPEFKFLSNSEVTLKNGTVTMPIENSGKLTLSSVTVNGKIEGDGSSSVINVMTGASIAVEEGVSVYMADGTLNILGGTIKGETAVYIKSAALEITGGELIATGAAVDYQYTSEGCVATGDALVIDNCGATTAFSASDVIVTGGYFNSANAKPIGSYYGNGKEEAFGGFVSGGYFNKSPEVALIASTSEIKDNTDDTYKYVVGDKAIQKYTVSMGSYGYTENGQVIIDSIATVAGGGPITAGDSVTMTAPTSSTYGGGYALDGWSIRTGSSESGYKYQSISDDKSGSFSYSPSYDVTIVARYKLNEKVSYGLTVNADSFTVKAAGSDAVNGAGTGDYTFTAGTQITITYTGSDTFQSWKNGSNKLVSQSSSYTFILGSKTVLDAMTKAEADKYVDFVNSSNQLLSRTTVTNGESGNVSKLALIDPPSRSGYNFVSWVVYGDDTELGAASNDAGLRKLISDNYATYSSFTIKPSYTKSETKCTVKFIYPDDYTGTKEESAQVTKGVSAKVKAEASYGDKTFSYWATDAEGTNIVSYDNPYYLYVDGDKTLYAIYATTEVEKLPTTILSGQEKVSEGSACIIRLSNTWSVPEGYELVEQGFLFTVAGNAEDLTLTNADNGQKSISKVTGSLKEKNGTYVHNFVVTKGPSTVVKAKGYIIYKKVDESTTNELYTELFNNSWSNM